MILIDFTQIVIGGLMATHHQTGEEMDDKLVRHVVLNTLRYYRTKFLKEYGELVICCDNKHYWRRDYFPNYKINRKKDREQSDYDWNSIFINLNLIRDEIKENFPYKVIDVHGAEADDIIGVLTKERNEDMSIIISSDKDFIQLHNYKIHQFSPLTKRKINNENPKDYLKEHILKGDRSDGIPNILSPDDTFVSEKRQKPMRKSVIKEVIEQMVAFDADQLYMLAKCPRDTWIRNWQRNETLIDLTKIPPDIQDKILKEYDSVKVRSRSGLLDYFISNRLNSLVENIGDF